MRDPRKLERERLQVMLVTLMLKYRRLILITGMLLLAYALAIAYKVPLAACFVLVPAAILLLMGSSHAALAFFAGIAAWFWTIGSRDD